VMLCASLAANALRVTSTAKHRQWISAMAV
jgi:hypothetical protein